MEKVTSENMPEIFRSSENTIDLELELIKENRTILLPFKAPGIIQLSELIQLMLQAFTPKTITLETLKDLNIEEVKSMSSEDLESLTPNQVKSLYRKHILDLDEEDQFKIAIENMGILIEDSEITKENYESIGKGIYTNLFFKRENIGIIEVLIRDCFELEARDLKDDVLMLMIGRLMTYLLEITAEKA